ncbi:MAG: DNA polymerase III subunit delta' [Candidatus Hydrogenedentota bacterium]
MAFADIYDQNVPVRLLRNIMRRGRVPNGLLFWGPGGVGKRLTATEFVKALNCAEYADDACGGCLPCRKVMSGNHPDVRITEPVKRSRIINVDAIEAVNEFAALRPFEGKWRVFILHDADRMGLPAQNHFLKTLEEPPGNSLFILLTEQPRQLLPTIRSRCQQVRFGALRPETVARLLGEQRELGAEKAGAIAALSQGQMSRALALVDSERREIVLDMVGQLQDGADPLALSGVFAAHLAAHKSALETQIKAAAGEHDAKEMSREDREANKLNQASQLEAQMRRDLLEYLYLLETWYRDALVYRATGDLARVLNRDQADRLAKAPEADYHGKLGAIEKARIYLDRFLKEDRVFRDLFFTLAA